MDLKLFGAPELLVDGEAVRFTRRKSTALVAYLALAERPQARERLATLLWPDSDTSHALASLRLVIHDITSTVDVLLVDADRISIDGDRVVVDAVEFSQPSVSETSLECLEATAALYVESFLRGFSLADAPEFDDWVFFTAERLQTRLGTVLQELVRRLTPVDTTRAIGYAERLVYHEPLDEDHHRAVMELYVTEGRFSAAIRQYEKCRELLERELHEEPSTDLTELYEALQGKEDRISEPTAAGSGYLRRTVQALASLSDQFTSASGVLRRSLGRISYVALALAVVVVGSGLGVWHSRQAPRIPTIVVVPFSYAFVGEQASSREPVAVTLTQFVQNELIQESRMNVRAARAALDDGAGTDELVRLGSEEDADYVLHGAILDDGEQYTITIQLMDRWSRDILLGEDFIATSADLAILLTALTDMTCGSIYDQIGPELTRYLKSGDALLNPYCETATLLAPFHMFRTLSESERAQFYSAIKESLVADEYTREGYFIQADMFWVGAIYGIMPPAGAEELLRLAIEWATEEEQSPELDIARGIYQLIYQGDAREASRFFAAAYRERPTSVSAARWYALDLLIRDQITDALEVLQSVEMLVPADPSLRLYLSSFHYLAGNYELAAEHAERSISRNDRWIGLMQRGRALLELDRVEEALLDLEEAVREQNSMQAPKAFLAQAYSLTGRARDAQDLLASMRLMPADDPSGNQSPALEAVVRLGLGQRDRAIEELTTAVEEHDPSLWLLLHDPVIAPVSETLTDVVPSDLIAVHQSL